MNRASKTTKDTTKEKLIESIKDSEQIAHEHCKGQSCTTCPNRKYGVDCKLAFCVDELIADGVTVQQWIPASEPPKEDGTYIVKTARGTVTTARFYAFKSFPATRYLPATHRQAAWQSNRKVTHWMHLPPKEGE